MSDQTVTSRILRLFGDILDYPQENPIEAALECEGLTKVINPDAAALLGEFRAFVEQVSLGRLQEVYTRSFDLDANHHPYVGHYLFGETYKRSAFLVGLKERYQTCEFSVEKELPDHLAVMLHFMAISDDSNMVGEIIEDALLPALEKMVGSNKKDETPEQSSKEADDHQTYQWTLRALQLLLQQQVTNNQLPTTHEEVLDR